MYYYRVVSVTIGRRYLRTETENRNSPIRFQFRLTQMISSRIDEDDVQNQVSERCLYMQRKNVYCENTHIRYFNNMRCSRSG